MARAMVGGLLNSKWRADQLTVSEPDSQRRQKLAQDFGIRVFDDNAECVRHADVIILTVKPDRMPEAVRSIAAVVQQQKPLLISVAAGIRGHDVLRWAGSSSALVRVMPNTPVFVNAAITALFATPKVAPEQCKLAEIIMQAVGKTLWVKHEAALDVITGISGSGPAYFFKLMEQMINSAVKHGLEYNDAHQLVTQTALGAAILAQHGQQTPAELRHQVTSRGGTTEAALTEMESLGLDNAIQQGINAAIKRSTQIADKFGTYE